MLIQTSVSPHDAQEGGNAALRAHKDRFLCQRLLTIGLAGFLISACSGLKSGTYKYVSIEEENGAIVKTSAIPLSVKPLWAQNVLQKDFDWESSRQDPAEPYFKGPIPFMLPPAEGSNEPFYSHNHQPSITWFNNGDLMAIWFSTQKESGTEMTVLASRLRAGRQAWDSSSEFFKAKNRNMTGSSLYNDGKGSVFHFNSLGAENAEGWANLAVLLRSSDDNGVTWTNPRAIAPKFKGRHQVINGTVRTSDGTLIQPCDARHTMSGGTALLMSTDKGKTWIDPGEGKTVPPFTDGNSGEGTIAGIHGGLVELKDGTLMAFGRSDNINGHMPMSISKDKGATWTFSASPFPPIGGGQRLVLMRLQEGVIMLVSFTHHPKSEGGMTFTDEEGNSFKGSGMFAALSYDEGKSWPVLKLITPGNGEFVGGGWTGAFKTSRTQAEPMGYLAATQTPDGIVHLISSRLHYRFNLKWLETPSPEVLTNN